MSNETDSCNIKLPDDVFDKSVSTDDEVYWNKLFDTDLLYLIDYNKLIWNYAIETMMTDIENGESASPIIPLTIEKIKGIAKGLLR
jgi:hypothetical protein